ncbi:MAG: hypothetical protein LIP77_07345 [Planctomycetes bacterium]|nr:hypothetical protein [Planctomycetota bacterium]
MRFIIAACCAMALAGTSWAVDYDLQQMQARLAEQEAAMGDLHAKLTGTYGATSGEPEGIISLRKNAVVTVGGQLITKYQATSAKAHSVYDAADDFERSEYRRRANSKTGSLEISDAYVNILVEVGDNFEAYLEMDLHNGVHDDYYNAEVYYLRWKNICESGFGLKVGRDALVFGEEGVGELGSYAAGYGDALGELDEDFLSFGGFSLPGGGPSFGGAIPLHNGWDVSGVTQVTPYWEGFDGKLLAEVSFMQNVYEDTPYVNLGGSGSKYTRERRSGYTKYRSRNYGLGTLSARVAWEPIEDLKFTASFANYRSNNGPEEDVDAAYRARNNTVYGLAASWRPAFYERLNIWGQWIYGKDVYFYKDLKSHTLNFGASYDILEGLTFFAQGDYLRTTYKPRDENQRGTAWAFYTGLQYSLPYGVSFEAGWKYERARFTDRAAGERLAKIRANTVYGMVGFEF